MAELIIDHTADDWCKLQLSIYVSRPEWFAIGSDVLQVRTNGASLLTADGTGANVRGASDSQLTTWITTGKPAGYNTTTKLLPAGAPIYRYTNAQWQSLINAARDERERYLASQSADPLDAAL
jgi:hypothetical protein